MVKVTFYLWAPKRLMSSKSFAIMQAEVLKIHIVLPGESEESDVCHRLVTSVSLRCSAGDRRRRPAPAEERDDDEVPGTEAGACAQTVLPHRQAQAEPLVIRRRLSLGLSGHISNTSSASSASLFFFHPLLSRLYVDFFFFLVCSWSAQLDQPRYFWLTYTPMTLACK